MNQDEEEKCKRKWEGDERKEYGREVKRRQNGKLKTDADWNQMVAESNEW